MVRLRVKKQVAGRHGSVVELDFDVLVARVVHGTEQVLRAEGRIGKAKQRHPAFRRAVVGHAGAVDRDVDQESRLRFLYLVLLQRRGLLDRHVEDT